MPPEPTHMEENTMKKPSLFRRPAVQSVLGIFIIVAVLVAVILYKNVSSRVPIDLSVISAPSINIGPQSEGVLQSVFVKAGDTVIAGEGVAQVGSEVLSAKVNGLVTSVTNTPGQLFEPGTPVITMIDPTQLRVVGTIDENKGLSKIKVGDPVSFTVDAFGSQSFVGVVDEIAPTAVDTSVVFSISDQRPTNQFDVKVAYDIAAYPQFKNGMSAKMKIYWK